MSIVFSKRPNLVVASAARTVSDAGSAFDVGNQDFISVLLDVTAFGGTSPSLTVSVEWSHDGTTWFQGDPADSFSAISTSGKKAKVFQVKGTSARIVWTISGTTPTFTFSVTTVVGS